VNVELLRGQVLVLLSGGRDSVCLLDLAVRHADEVEALHVDYGAANQRFCAQLCARLGVPLHVVGAGAPAGNFQAWARDVRYAEAEKLVKGVIAVGHTATDQVETVLYRLAASPGRGALLGMPDRRGRIVRPLLGMTREETAAYCFERGLEWREDPSNDSDSFARNRARHGLVPALRELHPAAEANVLRTLATLRDEAEVLDVAVDAALTDEVARLAALPPALGRLCLARLAGAPVGGRLGEVLALPTGGSLDLGGGLRVIEEYGRLRFERGGPAPPGAPAGLEVPGAAAFAGGELTCEVGDFPVADGTLDLDALAPPLQVRAWEPGDRMRPLGLGGSRSLQDLFTDRRVPREHRTSTPVVVSGGEIAWVPGVATGEAFRVTASTRRRARLTWHR
jgi:tRNA(Ile)-lysidine synthase